MKKLFIVANWKANKTEEEALEWLKELRVLLNKTKSLWEYKEIIICPSYPLLPRAKEYIRRNELPLQLGSQDVSVFGKGPYTGEVPGSLIYNYIRYCIIGHSERRRYFHEDTKTVFKKAEIATSSQMIPIFCVQDKDTEVPEGVFLVAYEPVFAIGTGNPDSPENADKIADEIKKKNKAVKYVLYGGSVTSKNVNSFTQMQNTDGVLVGSASLDASEFLEIIQNA